METDSAPEDRDSWKIWAGVSVVTVLGFLLAWQFVEPAPPEKLVMATGSADGAYHRFGQELAEVLARDGFELELRPSAGSIENVASLAGRKVDLAFVQGGTVPEDDVAGLVGLGSLYFEPLWIFARAGVELRDLRDLAGKRVVLGAEGSGTRAVALGLFEATGLMPSSVVEVPSDGADTADVVFIVASPSSSRVSRFMSQELEWVLFDVRRHAAYEARLNELSTVMLTEGMFDLGRNLPDREVRLLAPTAQLVAHEGLHHAHIPLLIEAAEEVFGEGGLFEDPGDFPSRLGLDVPVSEDANRYYLSGRSFLYRVLPFRLAALVDRLKVLLFPLLTLLLPLLKIAPPLIRWRIRSKIYRWYGVLRDVEKKSWAASEADERLQQALAEIVEEIRGVKVPPSYMEELYNLRMHLDLVRKRLIL